MLPSSTLLSNLNIEPALQALRHVLDAIFESSILDLEDFGALASVVDGGFRVELFTDAGVALGDGLGIGV